MNAVERMMKESGVEPIRKYCGNCEIQYLQYTNPAAESCKTCKDYEDIYPPFTAEKQIELIELISSALNTTVEIEIGYDSEQEKEYCLVNSVVGITYFEAEADDFPNALAQHIINLKPELKFDTAKVKEILQR